MSNFSRRSFEEWFDEVVAVARSWSVHPADINKISQSWFASCWRKGWAPKDALIAALEDVGMMDEEGRVY
jgi:hypothetical protein